MSNETVIRAFLGRSEAHTPIRNITNGIYTYKGQTLATDGKKLVNYSTVIAKWIGNNLIELNTHKYSVTTSKIQSKIRQLANEYGICIQKKDGE